MILTDNSPMPLGKKFKGTPMANVPDYHLQWWYGKLNERLEVTGSLQYPSEVAVLEYIKEFMPEHKDW